MTDHSKLAGATQAKYQKDPVYRGVFARFPRAMRAIARVSRDGTVKHQVPLDDMSFLDVPDAQFVYKEALSRHLVDEQIEGPVNAQDGGHLHAAHRAWCALADLEVALRDMEEKGK